MIIDAHLPTLGEPYLRLAITQTARHTFTLEVSRAMDARYLTRSDISTYEDLCEAELWDVVAAVIDGQGWT